MYICRRVLQCSDCGITAVCMFEDFSTSREIVMRFFKAGNTKLNTMYSNLNSVIVATVSVHHICDVLKKNSTS